jgi:plasmid replication initiation protein
MAKQKKKALPKSLLVTQANELVQARYNLPLGEQRLVLIMISKIQPEDEDFKPYKIRVGELAEFLGIDKGSAYRECKKITESLLGRVLSIDESDGLLQTNWVSSAKYIDGTGIVNLSFDPSLKPYLLQLKSNFTSCKLEMLLSFKSQYSVRIYTLLKQYEKLKEREIELEELRTMLGVRLEQYHLYGDFRRYVLQATQKELAEKSDLYFEFDEIKYGRRVGAIRFHIITKSQPKELPSEQLSLLEAIPNPLTSFANLDAPKSPIIDELMFLVPEQHKTKKTVLSAIIEHEKKLGADYVKRNILYSNAKSGKSYAGFLANALKQDWGHDWQLEQDQVAVTPVKKKVAEVWERQGFKSQKEYDAFMFEKQMQRYNKPKTQVG